MPRPTPVKTELSKSFHLSTKAGMNDRAYWFVLWRTGSRANSWRASVRRVSRSRWKGTGRQENRGWWTRSRILYNIQSPATERRLSKQWGTTSFINWEHRLTIRSSIAKCLTAAEHQTTEAYSNTGSIKLLKQCCITSAESNILRVLLKIPILWEAEDATNLTCRPKVNFGSNVTPSIWVLFWVLFIRCMLTVQNLL